MEELVLISLFAVFAVGVCSITWGLHSYPYPPKALRTNGSAERQFKDEGGLWAVIRSYRGYWRDTGEPLPQVTIKPLRGFIMAVAWSLLALALSTGALVLWAAILETNSLFIASGYALVVVLATTFLLPDMFVKYARLPGRVWDFPEDVPLGPMWWGFWIGIYGALAILKLYGLDLVAALMSLVGAVAMVGDISILGLPTLLFATIHTRTSSFLSGKHEPGMRTRAILQSSWAIGWSACMILGFVLLVLD